MLVLAVLVGIFVALGRHVKSDRLTLWTAAWVLIFVNSLANLLVPLVGRLGGFSSVIAKTALPLAALFFIASLTSFFENKGVTNSLLGLAGVPTVVYFAAFAYGRDWYPVYVVSVIMIFFGVPLFVALQRRLTPEALGWIPVSIVTGVVVLQHALRHDYAFGRVAMLTLGFALPGFLYCRRYPRWSPGVFASACGFLLWGSAFTFQALMPAWSGRATQGLWNTPAFFVALGMMLTLLEDKSEFLKSSREREVKLNRQLQRFAGITSSLLTGVDVNLLCNEVARAIMETSTFQRVVIVLTTDGRALVAAGHSGFEPAAVRQIEQRCASTWRMDMLERACREGVRLGQNSFLLR